MDITNRAGAEESQDRSIIADSLSDEREFSEGVEALGAKRRPSFRGR